jgi:BRCT domain type II-containing protein
VVVLGGDINNNREAAAELRELIEVQGGRVQKAVSIRTLLFADLVSAG